MLQIQGFPSRASLINQMNLKNSHVVSGCPHISTLFKLIEQEESPFKISKLGSLNLTKAIEQFPELKEYEPLVQRTLAVRVLQKCKNFYTNINFETLKTHLAFYGSWEKIEQLLYECNREGLIVV